MKNSFILLVCCLFGTLLLEANEIVETLRVKISYLGIPACWVQYETRYREEDYTMNIRVRSSWMASLFQKVNNEYTIVGTLPQWLPAEYRKKIRESNIHEETISSFDRNVMQYQGEINHCKIDTFFSAPGSLRDFFSALHWVRFCSMDSTTFFLEAAQKLWQGKMQWQRDFVEEGQSFRQVKIFFDELDPRPKAPTDILTKSLVNNRATLTINLTNDAFRYPAYMVYQKDDYCVKWHLLEADRTAMKKH